MNRCLVCVILLCCTQVPRAGGAEEEDQFGDPLPKGALARLGTSRFFMRESPSALQWSSDNSFIAVHYHVGMGVVLPGIHLVDAATGKTELTPGLSHGEFEGLAWSPDAQQLVTCEESGRLRIWDRKNAWRQRLFSSGAGECRCVDWSPDGATIASGTESDGVRLWNAETRNVTRTIPMPAQRVAFSGDGAFIAIAAERSVRVFSLLDLKQTAVWNGDWESCYSLEFSPDSKWLAVGGSKTLSLFSVDQKIRPRAFVPIDGVNTIAFHPSQPLLLTYELTGKATIWSMEEKKALYEFMGITGIGASFSPDGMKWVFPRRRLTQVDVKSREILDSFDAHDRDILNVVMPGDAATVVTGGIGPEILQWDLTTYRLKKRWSNPSGAQLLAISPDGGTLAVSTFQDTSVSLVRTADGMRTKLDGHGAALGGFAFDPSSDDRLVSMSVDGELHLWDTDRAIRLHTTPSEKVRGRNPFRTFSASGEGLMAVTLPGSGRVRILQASDLKTRSEIKVVPPETLIFMPIALSQDGRILATIFAGDDLKQPSVVALLDSATGSVIKRISSVSGLVTDLALSDDGALLAVASWERKSAADPPAHIFVYETSIGKMRHAFVGHEGMVRDMKFVPDGRLVTVSQDATALVWDVSENDRRQAR